MGGLMDFVIALLEENQSYLEREVRDGNLMKRNLKMATANLQQIGQLKRAIKILKQKNKKQ